MQQENNITGNFFSRLQKTLSTRGLSLTDLAARTGIALSTMYRWKDSEPQTRTVKQIAEALGLSPSLLDAVDTTDEREASAFCVREEPATYHVSTKLKLTIEDIARLLHFDLDTITRTTGDEQRLAFLTLRDVHLPSLAKLLKLD